MKNIIVCGASKNLGKYISEKFDQSDKVFGLSRTKTSKKNSISTDLSNLKDAKKALNIIKKKTKKIDAIIFCAGNSKKNYFKVPKKNDFNQSFNFNFYPFVNLINSYLEIFKKKSTKIIVISSIAGVKNIKAPITYSIAKNALNFYCMILAKELAKQKVIINIISPGNILMKNNNWDKKLKKKNKEVKNYIYENVPNNKFCNAYEIYKICELIIKNETNFLGSNIVIDGGQTL
jgi:3-oxoacyl-[acyl-carrier protein] reductase